MVILDQDIPRVLTGQILLKRDVNAYLLSVTFTDNGAEQFSL